MTGRLGIRLALLILVLIAFAGGLAVPQELTYDYVTRLAPLRAAPMTTIGTIDSTKVFQVGGSGSVAPVSDNGVLLQFGSGYPFVRFAKKGSTILSLTGGFYPMPVITWRYGGITYEETAFARMMTGSSEPVAMIKVKITNETVTKAQLPFFVFLGNSGDRVKDTQVPGKPQLKYPLTYSKGRLTDAAGNLVLYTPSNLKPEYMSSFVGAAFVQPVDGPVLVNTRKKVQTDATYSVQFQFDGKEIKLVKDSIDSLKGEKIKVPGFDLLFRTEKGEPAPASLKVRLNGKDIGFIAKSGFTKESTIPANVLSAGDQTPWVLWDSIKEAVVQGNNTLELIAVKADNTTRVESWKPLIAFKPAGQAVLSELDWPGDKPGEEWFRGIYYPYDTLAYKLDIAPQGTTNLVFYLPYSPVPDHAADTLAAANFDQSLDSVKQQWDAVITKSAKISVPVQNFIESYQAALASIFVASDGLTKENEQWLVPALDSAGYHDVAEHRLDYLFSNQGKVTPPSIASVDLDADGNGKVDGDDLKGYLSDGSDFSLASNGIILWEAVEHYNLTGNRAWLEKHIQEIIESCRWIDRQRGRTKLSDGSSKIAGIMPPDTVSITGEKTYRCSYNDAYNYLGLKSAATLLKELNNPEAAKLQASADDYRKDIIANTKAVTADDMKAANWDFAHYSQTASPGIRDLVIDEDTVPFVPMGPEMRVPSSYGGYALFGPVNLVACGVDEPDSERAGWITDFADKHVVMCEKVGGVGTPLGIPCWVDNMHDPGYRSADISQMLPYALSYLDRNKIDQFVAAFYTLQVYGANVPQAGIRTQYMLMLRNMLVREDDDRLRICQGVPREWLESGKKISVDKMPTHFGLVSFDVTSELVADRIICNITPPSRKSPKDIVIRFRHPKGQSIKSVELDGQPYTTFTSEEVTLSNLTKPVKLLVKY